MTGAWRLAARNLLRNRRRNAATGLAVAFGYAALVVLGGYVVRVERYLRTGSVYLQNHGHVSLYKKGGLELHRVKPRVYSLTAEEQRAVGEVLRADPEVETWGRLLDGMGLLGNGCSTVPFQATGIEPEVDRRLRAHPEVAAHASELARPLRGRALGDAAGIDGPVLVTEALARHLGKRHLHDEVGPPSNQALDCHAPGLPERLAADANVQLAGATFTGSFSALDGELVGIFSTGLAGAEDTALLTTLDELQRLYDTDRVTQILVFLHDHRRAAAVAARLELALAARGVAVDAFTYDDERANPQYVGIARFLLVMSAFIVLVVVTVVILSIVNSMTMTILERSRELGTLRSLGFTRRQVTGLFVREGLILTSISLVVGLVLGLVTAALVNAADVRFNPPGTPRPVQLQLTPDPLVCAVLAAALLVLAAGATLLATRRRVRARIVDLNAAVAA